MSWGKLDDRYDDNRKIRRAWKRNRAAVGLHAMAITYCARNETDGKVDVDWLEDKLPARREREKTLDTLVELNLFESVDDEHWQVHDYLDYNDSAAALEERRAKDRARKASGFRSDSTRNPSGETVDSNSPSRAPAGDARGPGSGGGSSTTTPEPSSVDDARAQIADPRVAETVEILRTCPRLTFDLELMGVANALLAYPHIDHRQAAHTTVSNASDPNWRVTDAGRALRHALADLDKRGPSKPSAESEADKWARREREWRAQDAKEQVA